jgi:hypothetical protein
MLHEMITGLFSGVGIGVGFCLGGWLMDGLVSRVRKLLGK